MLVQSIITFFSEPSKLVTFVISLSLAVVVFAKIRKTKSIKNKILLTYLHLFLLFFPLIFFAFSLSCDMGLLNGFIYHCSIALTKIIIYGAIASMIGVMILGYLIIPKLYQKKAKEIKNNVINETIKKYAKRLKISMPKLYLINLAKPLAFSTKNMVFLSAGLTNLLTKKELEAVLLHELSHIKNSSSMLKLSKFLIRFSPFSNFTVFNEELNKEEVIADSIAIKLQGTQKYLNSAKIKINKYNLSEKLI
ncbi:MAG: M48 family metalloprotease [Nanoarchaeota archaeon]